MESLRSIIVFVLAASLFIAEEAAAQCIVINEILVNAAGNDGTPPNSSEWVELMNTCNTPVDISCMIVGDGDFTVTIPSGTILAPNQVYSISSSINGQTPDLDWNSCGCSSNPTVTGSLSDAGEQLFVLDNTGNLVSGVYWGGGSFPAVVSSIASGGCTALSGLTLIDNTGFESIAVTEGTTNEQDCSGAWITSPSPSFGNTNSDQLPIADISITNNIVCQGGALNFSGTASSGISYSWTFQNGSPATSVDQNPIGVVFNSFGSQTVELTVSNSCGASDAAQVTIQVNQPVLPTITASGPTTLCQDESLTLSTTAPGLLQWQLDNADLAGEINSSITPTANGSYTVVANNGVCTEESAPVVVTINPVPTASLVTTDTEVCLNDPLVLAAAPGFTAYNWMENGVSISTLANFAVTTNPAATYNYELTVTENGCTSAPIPVSVIVHDYPIVQINPAGPIDLCPDDEVVLSSVNTHDTYQWYEDGVPTATTATLNVAYNQASTISLEATSNGCTSSVNPAVAINSNQVATYATWVAPPYALNNVLRTCLTEHPILGDTDGPIRQWFLNGTAIPGATGITLNATQDGDYYFSASVNGSCPIFSDTITVDVNVDMAIETTLSKDTACEGEIVQIIPHGNFVSYSWPGGIVADTLEVTNSGEFIVTAHLVSCETTDTARVFISAYPVVNAGEDFYSDCEDATMLYGATTGDESHWEIDGIEVASDDTIAIPTPTRTSDLVFISSLNGCEARDTVNMEVECIYVYAPTAITPDGDGLNDVFRIYAHGLSTFVLRIFDRYGQVIWETKDPEEVWTGGAPTYFVPNGIYTWQIEALDINQQEALSKRRNKGTILVIR